MRRKRLWYRLMSMVLAAAVTAATLPPTFAGEEPTPEPPPEPPKESATAPEEEPPKDAEQPEVVEEPEAAPEGVEEPKPSEKPEATPEGVEEPKPSEKPEATPEGVEESKPSEKPEATPEGVEEPKPSEKSEATPEGVEKPKASEAPEVPTEPAPSEVPEPEAAPAVLQDAAGAAASPAPAPQYHTLKIYYYYQDANGALTTAQPPELREQEGDKPYTVTPPAREGYEVDLAEGSAPLTGTMDADKTVTVLYIGAEVDYTVHHVFPDDPTLNVDEKLSGRIGTSSDARAKELPGYTAGVIENILLTGHADSVTISYDINRYDVFFDTQGGSAVPSQLNVAYGTEIELPAAPSRTAYTFGGWYADAACTGDAVTGCVTVSAETTYYAKWTAEKVAFNVVVMRENADDEGYSYAATVSIPAKDGVPVGSEISETDALRQALQRALTDDEKDYFTYVSLERGVLAKPDGNSVVIAYYSRNRYTIAFELNDNKAVITCGGTTYRRGDYKFTAKYGANIAAVWPTVDKTRACVISGKDGFSGWSRPSTSTVFTSMRLELTSEVIGSKTAGSTTTYTAGWKSRHAYQLIYRLQDLNSTGFTDMPRYTQLVDSESDAKSWNAKDIAEGTYVANSKKVNYFQNPQTITFDYTRNRFSITYHNLASTTVTDDIPYGTPLDGSYSAAPARPAGLADYYTFAGWYADPVYKTPYPFTTMPAGNVAVYAHWAASSATVSFDSAGGSAVAAQTVTKGQKANCPEKPSHPGYTFLGWYDAEDAFYDFYGSTVTVDFTLTAHWQEATLADYTVRYRFVDGTEAAPDRTVRGAKVGGTVKAQAVALSGTFADYAPDALYKTLTIDPDASKNVITFTYEPGRAFGYTQVYGWLDGNAFTEFTALRNEGTTGKSAVLLPNGHPEIPGYDSLNSSVYHELNLDGSTEFRYEYTLCRYAITYDLAGGTLAAGNPTSYRLTDLPLSIPNTPTRAGYEFLGWSSDDAGVATGPQAGIQTGATGNKTLTANWKPIIVDLTLTAGSKTFEYDGAFHDCTTVTVTSGKLKKNDTLVATATGRVRSVSDNAKGNNPVAPGYKVMRGKANVTAEYHIVTQPGTLTIAPAALTLTTDSATKEWDGTPLTAGGRLNGLVNGETLKLVMTGSQTDPGESKNTATLDWTSAATTAKAENYKLKTAFGTLCVVPNHTKITLTAGSDERVYNGTPLTQPNFTAVNLPKGFTATAEMSASSRLVDVGSAPNTIVSYKIYNGAMRDVTKYYDSVVLLPGTLEVTRRPAAVATPDAKKVYDAKPLQAKNATQQGFAAGEGVTFQVTGSRTNVGSSANAFTYAAQSGTKLTNYSITKTTGTLTVTPAPAEVIGNKGSFVYDGKPHTVNGAVVHGIASGYTLHISVAGVTRTEVGTSVMDLKAASYQVTLGGDTGTYEDGAICRYIDNYKLNITDGSITITAKPAPCSDDDDSDDDDSPAATPTPTPAKTAAPTPAPGAVCAAPAVRCIPATYGGWHEGFVPTTAHPLPGTTQAVAGIVPEHFANAPTQTAPQEHKPDRTAGLCALAGCGLAALLAAKKRKKTQK